MGRPELGHKFVCVGCGARFYDLNRSPAVCPKCEVPQPAEKPRVARAVGGGTFGRRSAWQKLPRAEEEAPEPAGGAEDADSEAEEDADDDTAEPDADVEELPDIEGPAL